MPLTLATALVLGAATSKGFSPPELPRGGDVPPLESLPACVAAEARSQHREDLMVLAPLRCMLNGGPGTFVELGAFTGVDLSNTVMLERCYNWTGVLIEASTTNFAQLATSGRRATKVHSAVCPGDQDSTVEFLVDSGDTSGEPSLRREEQKTKRWAHKSNTSRFWAQRRTERVPCRSLDRILDAAGFPKIDVLFLDVEGAEAKVLQAVDPRRFSVVVTEAAGYPDDGGRLETVVEPLLLRAGFRRQRKLEWGKKGAWNPAYVRADGPMSSECLSCGENKACRDRWHFAGTIS